MSDTAKHVLAGEWMGSITLTFLHKDSSRRFISNRTLSHVPFVYNLRSNGSKADLNGSSHYVKPKKHFAQTIGQEVKCLALN